MFSSATETALFKLVCCTSDLIARLASLPGATAVLVELDSKADNPTPYKIAGGTIIGLC